LSSWDDAKESLLVLKGCLPFLSSMLTRWGFLNSKAHAEVLVDCVANCIEAHWSKVESKELYGDASQTFFANVFETAKLASEKKSVVQFIKGLLNRFLNLIDILLYF